MRKLLATALLALLLAPGTASAGLVADLPLDGHTLDISVNENNGTFSGDAAGPTFVAGFNGNPNGAILFDGIDDRVDVTHAAGLPLTDHPAFTVMMWVKGDGVAFDDRRVFSEGSSSNNTPLFNLGTTRSGATDGPEFNSFLRPGPGHRKGTLPVFDGEWHHLAWVDDDGHVALYVDGVRDTTNFNYARQLTGLDRTTIGGILRATGCCYFNGAIDEVRLYDHALTKDEVRNVIRDATTGCPDAGDTHCDGIEIISSPLGGGPGAYTLEASGTDDGGDPIIYEIEILDADGKSVSFTRGDSATIDLFLDIGSLTIVVTADDDLGCHDQADDATCVLELDVTAADPLCVSHWALDGNLQDSSPQGNHGTFSGDAAGETYVEGFDGTPGGALLFDGVDDIVRFSHNSGLPIYYNPSYTATFWVKGDGTNQNDLRIFSEGSTTNNTPLLNIGTQQGAAGGDKVVAFIRMNGTNVGQAGSTSQQVVLDDEWHHVAWVDDNGQCKWYIDGILDGTMPSYARDPLIAMDTTTIGGILRGAASHFFAGAIDEVRVYNYALDEGEIQDMVPDADDCDGESDTTCDGIAVASPPGQIAGLWTFTATGSDTGGDEPLFYTFELLDSEGASVSQIGPTNNASAEFSLDVGDYTVRVTVDDRLDCFSDDPDTCETSVSAGDVPLLTSVWALDGDLTDSGNFIGSEDSPGNDGTWNGDNDPVFVQGYDCDGGAITQAGDGQGNPNDDMIVVNSNVGLPLWNAGAFTISAWVRGEPQPDKRFWSESNRSGNNRTLFNLGTGFNLANGAKVDFYLRDDTGNAAHFVQGPGNHRLSTQDAFDGTWHHICWVDDNGDVTLYVDGIEDGTDFDYVRPAQMTIDTTTIGGILRANGTCCEFAGDIDQVQVFNFVLSAEDVEELCSETAPSCCPQEGDDDFADTTCDGINVQPVGGAPRPSMFQAQAFGADVTGDDVIYVFSATSADHDDIVLAPQSEDTAMFDLLPGEWEISASVDDDPDCPDASASAVCSTTITVLPPCPTEGDTHCDGIDVSLNEGPGDYTFTANATDDSGDDITYTFTAVLGEGDPIVQGPQAENTATFTLDVDGVWTISVSVDDDDDCTDVADDATCSVDVTIESGVGPFNRGDSNGDGAVELADAIYLFNFLFLGGPEPRCRAAADSASEGQLNLTGGVYTLSFLFLGGSAPASPFPECGRSTEESDVALGCESYTACE